MGKLERLLLIIIMHTPILVYFMRDQSHTSHPEREHRHEAPARDDEQDLRQLVRAVAVVPRQLLHDDPMSQEFLFQFPTT